jgi:CubicO group peptidase (beta-lactamase class C family)
VAPELPHAEAITARQLLYHRSGLGASGLPPREALEEASTQPLAFTPGEDWLYSDVGYFALGVLAERFTGERYTTLVRRRLLKPLHLRDTYMEEKIDPTSEDHDPSRNRWSAGGLISTVDDAAAWAVGFWGAGLDTAVSSLAVELDASTRLGAGTFGFCPCSTDEAGALRAGSYGHISPGGRTAWSGEDGLGIAVHTIESLDQRMFDAWADLDSRLRHRVAGRALDPTPG